MHREQPVPQAEIITLAFHVDYWNYLGWKDEFSSPMFSQRQELYGQKFKIDSIYTPQMIVDGKWEFVGNDSGKATKTIQEASKIVKFAVQATFASNLLKIKIPELTAHEDATVFLAIAEDNLKSEVSRGENSGRTLEHISVVRELKTVGRITATENSFETEVPFQKQATWKQENLKFVVFVQENKSRKIIGLIKVVLE
ncbi:hypothetical protein BH10ACI1_BH10ACI1_06230 [soil metagenome]